MVIVIGVWMYLAPTARRSGRRHRRQRHLLPFQTLIRTVRRSSSGCFASCRKGCSKPRRARRRGAWPPVAALAADGIPPFAPDPTAKGGPLRLAPADERHVRQLSRHARSGRTRPAWLVLVQEPEPGVPPDPAFEDEEHHRLLDGTMLHVSTWVRSDAARRRAGSSACRRPKGGRSSTRSGRLPRSPSLLRHARSVSEKPGTRSYPGRRFDLTQRRSRSAWFQLVPFCRRSRPTRSPFMHVRQNASASGRAPSPGASGYWALDASRRAWTSSGRPGVSARSQIFSSDS